MDSENLIRLSRPQVKEAIHTLVKAFGDYPLFHHYFPDEPARDKIIPYFMSVPVFIGLRYGEVYATSPKMEGIAIWLPSDRYLVTPGRLLRSAPVSVIWGLSRYGGFRTRQCGEHMDAVHQRLAPFKHWFLQTLGVVPEFQGQGFASQLVKPMLARMDKEGVACYLETLDENNVSLYEHFGFKVIDESGIPGTNLTNRAMLREAL